MARIPSLEPVTRYRYLSKNILALKLGEARLSTVSLVRRIPLIGTYVLTIQFIQELTFNDTA